MPLYQRASAACSTHAMPFVVLLGPICFAIDGLPWMSFAAANDEPSAPEAA